MVCGKRGREPVEKQAKPMKSVAAGGVMCTIHYVVSTGEKDYSLRVNLLLGDLYKGCVTEEELKDDVGEYGNMEWKRYLQGELLAEMLKKDEGFACFTKADLYDAEDPAEDAKFSVQVRVPFAMRLEGRVDEKADGKMAVEVLGWECGSHGLED